jgi:hypothetical protein
VTASHGPPFADSQAGGAEIAARPVTSTGTAASLLSAQLTGEAAGPVTWAGSGGSYTVAGAGGGI